MITDFRSSTLHLAGLVSILLHWTPEQFWKATPMELRIVFEAFSKMDAGRSDGIPLDQSGFEKLKEQYPDG